MREPAPVVHSTVRQVRTSIKPMSIGGGGRCLFCTSRRRLLPAPPPSPSDIYQRTSQLPTSHLQCREGDGGRTNCPRWPPPFVCVCVCAVSSPQDKKAVTWGAAVPSSGARRVGRRTGQEGPSRFWWKEGKREEEEEALREGEKPKKTP